MPGDRRRMATALLLATALNAAVVVLPAARGPAEEGRGPPQPISVLLAAPAAPAGQGNAASHQATPADTPPAPADAVPAPQSAVESQPETLAPDAAIDAADAAPEPGPGEVPPEAPAKPSAVVASPEPARPELAPTESSVVPAPRPPTRQAARPKPAATQAAAPTGRGAPKVVGARKVATAEPPGIAAAKPGVTAAAPSRAGEGQTPGAGVPAPAVDTEAVPLVRVAPVYPLAARSSRTEGRVLVEFTIRADGSVTDPTVVEASPAGVFERAVLQAIRQWRFAPRVEEGAPVSRRARQTVRFSLSS